MELLADVNPRLFDFFPSIQTVGGLTPLHLAAARFSNLASPPRATLHCPTCLKLGISGSYFCSQDCFKTNWATHKLVHRSKQPDIDPFRHFAYTGPLRAQYPLSPMRTATSYSGAEDNETRAEHVQAERERNALSPLGILRHSTKSLPPPKICC
ncbi:MAG: hypothetical protein BJ554DRAFT_4549 [Olpidium bornovanus]|uniref:C6H2-type domain-containing protein n=1 Tax=Olpidium bornovanus TaxID=278681 RepID=A0A8H7ZM41_9FUNG|nr:MAG: hypothetical protein BJ554DRAFT_4549 [Olpidium bornovanus]